MAAVALSASATALTTGPAPAPAQTAQAPGAFAKLVAGAKPDGKASQESARPDASTDAEADAAAGGSETTTLAAPDSETSDSGADQPVDLLSEIEAMVAAAGQLGVSQPVPLQIIPASPVDAGATAEPAAIGGSAASIATTTALAPAITLPGAAETPATQPAPALPDPGSARVTPAGAPPADVALANVAPTDAAAPNTPEAGDPGTATPAKKSGDIAALIASLKSAFQAPKGKDGVVDLTTTAATDVAILTPQAATTVPVGTSPIPADVPAAAEFTPPAAGVAENASAVATPIIPPKGGKATGEPIATAGIEPDSSLKPEAAAPDGSRAPADKASLPAEAGNPATDAPAPADPAPDAALAAAIPVEPGAAPAAPSAGVAEASDTAPAAPSQAEQSITRHLDLARDNQWLDRLARDISAAATQQGHLKFQLNPEHLGALTVEIANSAAGTAIRLTADTDQARAILADAQPRLLAEVRAQGLRVAESHVDLNQQGGGSSASAQGQQRQASEDHKPFARTQTPTRGDADDSAPQDDGDLYA